MAKIRLDLLLVERGLVESRARAQGLVMAGQVRVDGETVFKPSHLLAGGSRIEIDHGPPFVSRGGEKLAAALQAFQLSPAGLVCADVGASTGGFTDCLLQAGAARVYAIDVGKGILHWKLRNDPRVTVMENTNARYIERLPEPVDLATIDASFISLKILLPVVAGWLKSAASLAASGAAPAQAQVSGWVIALIKPQFEAGRKEVSKGSGVIRDPETHRRILSEVLSFALQQGCHLLGLRQSPVLGPKGNIEFLAWLGSGEPAGPPIPLEQAIAALVLNDPSAPNAAAAGPDKIGYT